MVSATGLRWGQLGTRQRWLFGGLLVVVSLPFVIGAITAWRTGYYPSGDDGFILMGTRRVFSPQLPLTGELTSSEKFGVDSYHPAPVAFFVQAPFVALLGERLGMVASAAAAGALSMQAIGYVTLRTAGLRRAVWAWIVVVTMGISIGGMAFLYRPFKSVVAVLPLMLFLFAAWAVASGKLSLTPIFVAAACYPAGSSAQYVTFVGAVTAVTVVAVVVQRWAERGPPEETTGDDAGGTGVGRRLLSLAPRTRRGWTTVALSVLVGLVAWGLPLYEAAIGNGGNLRQLYRAARAATGETVGISHALTDGARALLFNPAITRAEQAGSARGAVIVVLLLVVLAAVLLVAAWPRLSRTDRMLQLIAAVAVAATGYAVSTLPGNEGYAFYRLLATSVTAAFVWFAVGSVVPVAVRRVPAIASAWAERAPSERTGLAVGAVVVALLSLRLTLPTPLQDSTDYLQWTMRAVPDLTPQISAALDDRDGLWTAFPLGPRSTKVVLFGLSTSLEEEGFHTNQRRPPGLVPDPERPDAGQLVVLPSFQPPPVEGWELVGHYEPEDWDPDAADEVARRTAEFARESGAQLNEVTTAALPALLCPDVIFGAEGGCPEAEAILASDDPMAEIPGWLAAVIYVETFDEQFPFAVLDGPVPPDDLLEALREHWVDIPVDVYARPAG